MTDLEQARRILGADFVAQRTPADRWVFIDTRTAQPVAVTDDEGYEIVLAGLVAQRKILFNLGTLHFEGSPTARLV